MGSTGAVLRLASGAVLGRAHCPKTSGWGVVLRRRKLHLSAKSTTLSAAKSMQKEGELSKEHELRLCKALGEDEGCLTDDGEVGSRNAVGVGKTQAAAGRLSAVKVLLRADEKAVAHLLTSPEGVEVLSHLDLHDIALRMCEPKDAMPKEADVFNMVVEQPALLLVHSIRTEVARVRVELEALYPNMSFDVMAEKSPCAFAHVLQRCIEMESGVDPREMEDVLRMWLEGKREWYHVFTARVGSEWGYLQSLSLYETKTLVGPAGFRLTKQVNSHKVNVV